MTTSAQPVFAAMAGVLLLQTGSVPIWVVLAIILVIVLIFWWGLTRNNIPSEEPAADAHSSGHATEEVEMTETSAETEAEQESVTAEMVLEAAPEGEQETTTADDLQKIEGIGPKIEALLDDAGIKTFGQLANTDVADLERIIRVEAGIRVADPRTWPVQAGFAAEGDWEALDAYQKRLIAGREQGA